MANQAWVLTVALLCAACGGSADGDRGSGGAGSAATPSQAAQDAVARLGASAPLVCDQTQACYGTRCEGPTAMGERAVFPGSELPPLFRTCLEELAGEYPELVTWANCTAQAGEDETACLSDCPATVDACLTAGNDAIAACREGIESAFDAVTACLCRADPATAGCD